MTDAFKFFVAALPIQSSMLDAIEPVVQTYRC